MFFVISAHPLHGTRLVAVWVVRYTVVIGLRLQGIKVLSVVVQVGEGMFLALLYSTLAEITCIWLEKDSRSHRKPQGCCGYGEEIHDVGMASGSDAVSEKGCIVLKSWV